MTAPKEPPRPVDEVLPTTKPEGENVRWIPGYWHWDAERTDFIWVCGCYRIVPPDRTWEAGHWNRANGAWTYFPGYWRPADAKSLTSKLPEPPASTETAPAAPKENANAMWVPGVWEYKSGRFEWQPGYWPAAAGNMLWQQGQYVVAEDGYTFVPGYWDYPLEERGLLYSPMIFSKAQREKRGWSYRPEYAVSFASETGWGRGGIFKALFIGPGYNNYYYGDFSRWSTGEPMSVSGLPMVSVLTDYAAPLLKLYGYGAYQPWSYATSGYTNPLWQHYTRLNRDDSAASKTAQAPDAPRPTSYFTPWSYTGYEPSVVAYTPGVALLGPTVVRPNRVINSYAYADPAAQVVGRKSIRVVSTDGGFTQQYLTKNTATFQRVTPHGNLKAGVMQTWSLSPPVYGGGYRR